MIPFALCGRFTYSGMTLEKLLLAFIRDFHPLAHNFGVPIRSIMRFLDKKIENLFMAAFHTAAPHSAAQSKNFIV